MFRYVLKHKSQVFQYFKEWKAKVERETGRVIKTLCSDNGGEYTSTEFQSYLKAEGITHECSVPKSLEQNGEAERLNRTLMKAVRSMLVGSQLPQRSWVEALSTAVYLRNRSPKKSVD
uniref:Integrase catalytic domain-containing protein n=1 Tax=Amphimedon queenslandica TaxID=400682 RepID=A0A1X7SX39_AMPQE